MYAQDGIDASLRVNNHKSTSVATRAMFLWLPKSVTALLHQRQGSCIGFGMLHIHIINIPHEVEEYNIIIFQYQLAIFLPVHKLRKFSHVFGQMSEKSSKTILPPV